MKLSATYLRFMINFTNLAISPSVKNPGSVRISVVDSIVLTIIALYMMNDSEALLAMQAALGNEDPRVAEAWNNLYDSIVIRNNIQIKQENIDVNDLIRKLQ